MTGSKFRKTTNVFLILALLLQTAVAPLAFADPTPEEQIRAQQAKIEAELTRTAHQSTPDLTAKAREENKRIADALVDAYKKGRYLPVSTVSPEQRFRSWLASSESVPLQVSRLTLGQAPTTEQLVQAQVTDVHAAIDQIAATSTDPHVKQAAAQAHAEATAASDAVLDAHKKGLLEKIKGIPPDQWLRYLLAGGKALGKMYLLGDNGVAAIFAGGAIEIGATAAEFPITNALQNWPIDTRESGKIPQTKETFWKRFWIANLQQTLWMSMAYNLVVPTFINVASAWHKGTEMPTIETIGLGWGLGAVLTLGGALGYTGNLMLENAGRLKPWVRNVLSAAVFGMIGYTAGVYGLLGGDAAVQHHHNVISAWITGGLTVVNLGIIGLGLKFGKLEKPNEEAKPAEEQRAVAEEHRGSTRGAAGCAGKAAQLGKGTAGGNAAAAN